MLDLRLIREQPEQVKTAIASLFTDAPIDEIIAVDERRRTVLTEVEQLKAKNIAGHVFSVNSHQGFFLRRNVAFDQGEMLVVVNVSVIDDGLKLAAHTGRQGRAGGFVHE